MRAGTARWALVLRLRPCAERQIRSSATSTPAPPFSLFCADTGRSLLSIAANGSDPGRENWSLSQFHGDEIHLSWCVPCRWTRLVFARNPPRPAHAHAACHAPSLVFRFMLRKDNWKYVTYGSGKEVRKKAGRHENGPERRLSGA